MTPNQVHRVLRRVLFVGIFGAILVLVYRFRFVELSPGNDSVPPPLVSASRVVVDRLPVRGSGSLEHGDLVVIETTLQGRLARYLVEVGALPGDTVANREENLWVGGEPTSYPAVPGLEESRVPPRHYLLFTPNRRASVPDSVEFGFVPSTSVLSRLGAVAPF